MVRKTLYQRWRQDALDIFQAGVEAVTPEKFILRNIRIQGDTILLGKRKLAASRIWVAGAGKVSARMARILEGILGDRITGGVVITKGNNMEPLKRIQCLESSHPIPDASSVKATKQLLESLSGLDANDRVLFLLSGGASAMMELPHPKVPLKDLQKITNLLLHSEATIHEINCLRKHISAIKGGQLLRYLRPAKVWTWVVSDVVGDDLDVIGSGPVVPDPTTFKDARRVLEKYRLWAKTPDSVRHLIDAGIQGNVPETPKPGDDLFRGCFIDIIANNQMAVEAAARKARTKGYHTLILTRFMEGETHTVARMLLAVARQVMMFGQPIRPPACLIMGGETTLKVSGPGLGGRNQQLALYAGSLLKPNEPIVVLSAGTDGEDGPTDAAGGLVDASLMANSKNVLEHPLQKYLEDNDAYPALQRLGGLIRTGPTGTNVMDITLALVGRTYVE